MSSSYNLNKLEYKHIFESIIFSINPKLIVEFGILNGYSLNTFANYTSDKYCKIHAYDIFEIFKGNGANRDIIQKYKKHKHVTIDELDFYKGYKKYADESIDILHIDIANCGSVYEFCIDYYLCKISKNGLIILEGGSVERDNVEWMKKYNKKSINDYLEKLKNTRYDLNISTIDIFPSLTLIKYK